MVHADWPNGLCPGDGAFPRLRILLKKCVTRYDGNFRSGKHQRLDQFLCLGFAQLTYRESLRDNGSLCTFGCKELYHMGFREKRISPTLADANESVDWRIYADFAQVVSQPPGPCTRMSRSVSISTAPSMHRLHHNDLCLSLSFPWAQFQPTKERGEDAYAAGFARGSHPHFH